jgi:hypothetical protein
VNLSTPSANAVMTNTQPFDVISGPSSLEETQRELRELRELVLRIANGGQSMDETASVGTGITPPPVYTTERGLHTPVYTSSPEITRLDTAVDK